MKTLKIDNQDYKVWDIVYKWVIKKNFSEKEIKDLVCKYAGPIIRSYSYNEVLFSSLCYERFINSPDCFGLFIKYKGETQISKSDDLLSLIDDYGPDISFGFEYAHSINVFPFSTIDFYGRTIKYSDCFDDTIPYALKILNHFIKKAFYYLNSASCKEW